MPAKYTKTYTGDADLIYDAAKNNALFIQSTYDYNADLGLATDYAFAVYRTPELTSDKFDYSDYTILSDKDRFGYLYHTYYEDEDSETYLQNEEYYKYAIQQEKNRIIYNSSSIFEKIGASAASLLTNAFAQIYSFGEDLIDGFLNLVGRHDLAAVDTTGARALEKSLNNFVSAYAVWDKSTLASIPYQVVGSISRMAPMLITSAATGGAASIGAGIARGVGTGIYYGGMFGRSTYEAYERNPDINYGQMLLYAAGSTLVEAATEKLSDVAFGKANIIDNLISGSAVKVSTAFADLGMDMFTEGFEEFVSGMIEPLIEYASGVGSGEYNWQDIILGTIIGGLTGGIMTGGRIMSTTNLTVDSKGQLAPLVKGTTKAELSSQGLKKLSKVKSYDIMSAIANADVANNTNVMQLQAKYANDPKYQASSEYAAELKLAEEDDTKAKQKAAEAAVRLGALLDSVGAESFERASKLVNDTIESTIKNARNWLDRYNKVDARQSKANQLLKAINPDKNILLTNRSDYSDSEMAVVKALEAKGIEAYIGEYGDKNGSSTQDINTIGNIVFIEKGSIEKYGLNGVLEKQVKQQLANEMARVIGLDVPKQLKKILDAILPQQDGVIRNYKTLTKEEQQAFASAILFDDLTVKSLFKFETSTFLKICRWCKNKIITNRDNKIMYNQLLKIRQRQIKAVGSIIGNEADIEDAVKFMGLTDTEREMLEANIVVNNQNKYIRYFKINTDKWIDKRNTACLDLETYKKEGYKNNTNDLLDWKNIYNEESYTDEFREILAEEFKRPTFSENLWEYFYNNYDLVLCEAERTIYAGIEFTRIVNMDFWTKDPTEISNIFDVFPAEFLNDFNLADLTELVIYHVPVQGNIYRGYTDYANKEIIINTDQTESEMRNTILHELTHYISNIQGLPRGASISNIMRSVSTLSRDSLVDLSSRLGVGLNYMTMGAIIYYNMKGERLARGEGKELALSGDYFDYVTIKDKKYIKGYGKFNGVLLEYTPVNTNEFFVDVYSSKNLKALKSKLGTSDEDLISKGFNDDFVRKLDDRVNVDDLVTDITDAVTEISNTKGDVQTKIGTREAVNILLKDGLGLTALNNVDAVRHLVQPYNNPQLPKNTTSLNAALVFRRLVNQLRKTEISQLPTVITEAFTSKEIEMLKKFDDSKSLKPEQLLTLFFGKNSNSYKENVFKLLSVFTKIPQDITTDARYVSLYDETKNTESDIMTWCLKNNFDFSLDSIELLDKALKSGLSTNKEVKNKSIQTSSKDSGIEQDAIDIKLAQQAKEEYDEKENADTVNTIDGVEESKKQSIASQANRVIKNMFDDIDDWLNTGDVVIETKSQNTGVVGDVTENFYKTLTAMQKLLEHNPSKNQKYVTEFINKAKSVFDGFSDKYSGNELLYIRSIWYNRLYKDIALQAKIRKTLGESTLQKLKSVFKTSCGNEYFNVIHTNKTELENKLNLKSETKGAAKTSAIKSTMSSKEYKKILDKTQKELDDATSERNRLLDRLLYYKQEIDKVEAKFKLDKYNQELKDTLNNYKKFLADADVRRAELDYKIQTLQEQMTKYEKVYERILASEKVSEKQSETVKSTGTETPKQPQSSKDTKGRTLDKETLTKLKDSKIRNSKGDLLVVYHGSPSPNITDFNFDGDMPNNFFTTSEAYARKYTKDIDTGEDTGAIYESYLNIKNPFDALDPANKELTQKILGYVPTKRTVKDTDTIYKYLKSHKTDFDGIVAGEELSQKDLNKYGKNADISFVPLNNDQIIVLNKTNMATPKQTTTEPIISATVAPYLFKPITSKTEAAARRKVDAQFKQKANEIATALGLEIDSIEDTIGGYYFDGDDPKYGGKSVDEVSYVFNFKTSDHNLVDEFAMLLGDLGYEGQKAVITSKYIKETESATGAEHKIFLNSSDGVIETLKKLGMTNYTFNPTDKTISFYTFNDLSEEDVNDILKQIDALIEALGDKYETTQHTNIQSRYIEQEDRRDSYKTWSQTGGIPKQNGVVRNITTEESELIKQALNIVERDLGVVKQETNTVKQETKTKEKPTKDYKSLFNQINDDKYRTDVNSQYYRERSIETKGLSGDALQMAAVHSQKDFLDAKKQFLSQISTVEDYDALLTAIETGEIDGWEANALLTWMVDTQAMNMLDRPDLWKRMDALQLKIVHEAAATVGSRSMITKNENPVTALVSDLARETGVKYELSDEIIKEHLPEYAKDYKEYVKSLQKEIEDLNDKIAKESDEYKKSLYELEQENKLIKANLAARKNALGLLEEKLKSLLDQDVDKTSALAQYNKILNDVIKDITAKTSFNEKSNKIELVDTTKGRVLSKEASQKLVNALHKLQSWRYLAMLSNPATATRNALVNTLVSLNAIIEDKLGGGFTSVITKKDAEYVKQATYVGDYDANFKTAVENTFLTRIKDEAKGNKYNTKELDTIRQKYAEESDPIKKSKLLSTIQKLENKALNDAPWTWRRHLRNLTNALSGARNFIMAEIMTNVKNTYYKGVKNKSEITNEQVLDTVRKTNPKLADDLTAMLNGDLSVMLSLGVDKAFKSDIIETIYQDSRYRANELLFKVDNSITRAMTQLRKHHPVVAEAISAIVPFIRTAVNTTSYILNHSPVGIVKGIVKTIQYKNMIKDDMRNELILHYKQEYAAVTKKAEEDFYKENPDTKGVFEPKSFERFVDESDKISDQTKAILRGSDKNIKEVYESHLKEGKVTGLTIGTGDLFAAAKAGKSFAEGTTGTVAMTLGIILASLLDNFDIDDDEDYIGPYISIGALRLRLSDLSPFGTMFVIGASLTTDRPNKFGDILSIFNDQSILNVLDSAFAYNKSLPEYLQGTAINLTQQYVPAIFKSLTKILDRSKKDKSGNFVTKLLKTLGSNLPGVSYLVSNKINPYTGESEKYYQNVIDAFFNMAAPVSIRYKVYSQLEKDAMKYDARSTGLAGSFIYNGTTVNIKNKESLAKYRSDYINKEYEAITKKGKLVTVERDDGARITTSWSKLTPDQKQTVIKRLYTEASTVSKIKYWTIDLGNIYRTNSKTEYNKYRSLFGSHIQYKENWNKSKFIK